MRGAMCLMAATAALLAGCSQQTINSAKHDANHDVTVVGQVAHHVVKAVQPDVRKASLGGRVTTALVAAGLNGIRVDAAPDGVTLVGHVGSASDKRRALQIARDTLGAGMTVHSRLTAGSTPSGKQAGQT